MKNDNANLPTDESSDCISPRELVNRHLQDENHEISEEDLQKVAIDCGDANVEEPLAAQIEGANSDETTEEDSIEQKDSEKEEKDIIITPLDVIGS